MRIAVLILSLVLMVVLALQSIGYTMAVGLAGQHDSAGVIGLLVAFLWLLGAALVLAKPGVSEWFFGVAGLVALVVTRATPTSFTDLTVWGIASFGLAFLCQLGKRELKQRAKEVRET